MYVQFLACMLATFVYACTIYSISSLQLATKLNFDAGIEISENENEKH